ncbi:hypothetical protein H5410_006809 [Solanum commersonii]|uniref:Uncharacterized protein n=1 Tax=Solanum commersonii TaxID=4109 RepID=A0A9J6ACD2_SOLCO|nr:hypothetical protein H5410_006809 [Solanum commersonii]
MNTLTQSSQQLKEEYIDKESTEINHRKVQIETRQKMIKKLTKRIEESKKEKERLAAEKVKLLYTFKEIKQKAFVVKEDYNTIHELFDEHSASLNDAKNEIQKDSVDPEKLQTTLRDGTLGETCDLNSTLEMVAILEAQLKEMNPNLDSTSEYAPANIYMQLKLVGLQFLLIY